jgi:hypothetical protein
MVKGPLKVQLKEEEGRVKLRGLGGFCFTRSSRKKLRPLDPRLSSELGRGLVIQNFGNRGIPNEIMYWAGSHTR